MEISEVLIMSHFFNEASAVTNSLREEASDAIGCYTYKYIKKYYKKAQCKKHISKLEKIVNRYDKTVFIIDAEELKDYIDFLCNFKPFEFPIHHCKYCDPHARKAVFEYNIGEDKAVVEVADNGNIKYSYVSKSVCTMSHINVHVKHLTVVNPPKMPVKYSEQFMAVASSFGYIIKQDTIAEIRKHIEEIKHILNS